jgi:parvulin-like peptidyl-prolyl isomerase
VKLGKKNDKDYISVSAKAPDISKMTLTKTESKEELEKKDKKLQARDAAEDFNKAHSGWVYEISSWRVKDLRKPLSELVEDIPEKDEPKEIAASHILISYKGADRSDAKRSKAEAKKLAEKVLKEAKANGADFAALAKKYSDGPSKTKGGDLGTFNRGKMAKPFEDAAFKLKVDQVSDVVETSFGFHIIKRTK